MQAVIMAGGKGTRLASVTPGIPKPMVPVNGRPLLEYQIENLRDFGVSDIILVVGYLGNVIKSYFKDGSGVSQVTGKPFRVKIRYYSEESPLGTAGALGKITEMLEDTFLLVFGDLFTSVDYRRFVDYHKEKNAAATLFVHPNSHPYDSDIVVMDETSRVTGWSSKKSDRQGYYKNIVNAGLYVLDKKIAQIVSDHQKNGTEKVDLEKDVITRLLGRVDFSIFGYRSPEYVKDIGTPERLEAVQSDYTNGICYKKNLVNKQKCVFLDRDGTINKYVGFLRCAEQLELVDGVPEAIHRLNTSEYLTVVITNQPVVARGECSFFELDQIHNKMHTLLGQAGAYVDGLYFCPHHPDSGFSGEVRELKIECDCRKPKTGLLQQAAVDLNIDLSGSWFVGDTGIDVQTGVNAGMRTILLLCGDTNKNGKYRCNADYVARDLADAVEIILNIEEEQD